MSMHLLTPVYKEYIWGGNHLEESYHKSNAGRIIAESWECSSHPDGVSLVEGIPLNTYAKQLPILIKLIDAKNDLSVQVHPDNAYAQRVEHDNGKKESWTILDCEDGAFIYFGFEHPCTKQQVKEAIEQGTLTELLHKEYVHPKDVFTIQPGTVHAIGKGITLYEIQQCSNVTYRLYDYQRKDANGKMRPLHIEKGLEVANLEPAKNQICQKIDKIGGSTIHQNDSNEYFTYSWVHIQDSLSLSTKCQRGCCTVVLGEITLSDNEKSLKLRKGESVFVDVETQIQFTGNGDCLWALFE